MEESKGELEEVEEKANEGEILVLKRDLSNQKGVEDGLLNTFTNSEQGKGFTLILVPIKPIPFTPIQDISCSGPKLAQFTPPKQNPNPARIHLFIFSFPQHPLKFHMADVRDTEAKFKPSLFEELILFQPSSPLFLGSTYLVILRTNSSQQRKNDGGLITNPQNLECLGKN